MVETLGDRAVAALRSQAAKGLKKYGVTLEDAGLGAAELVQHAVEEAADGLHYALMAQSALRRMVGENKGMREALEACLEWIRDEEKGELCFGECTRAEPGGCPMCLGCLVRDALGLEGSEWK